MGLSGCWQVNVTEFNRSVLNRNPALSSKGMLECPDADCPGTIQWARDFVGYYYVQCLNCKYQPPTTKAS